MRIVSMVPSATEILFAVGVGERVVGVTHECDYPSEAARLPNVTSDVLERGLRPGAVDSTVREQLTSSNSTYRLDEEKLRALTPDLIVTQELCAVCAVSYDDVCAVAHKLQPVPTVIRTDPHCLRDIFADIVEIGKAVQSEPSARQVVTELQDRIDRLQSTTRTDHPRSVIALEWPDPPYIAGHWTPELISLAGGIDLLGSPKAKSQPCGWDHLASLAPDVLILMQCGYNAAEAAREAIDYRDQLSSVKPRECYAVDGSSYFSRPGPRVVDGAILCGHLLHRDRVSLPKGLGKPIRIELDP